MIALTPEDFATLAICAIRYCHGRQTYMPGLVQRIIRPHLAEIGLVGIILEVPQQLVDVVEVHVVMVHLVVTVGIAADIAVRVHLRMPLLFRARHLLFGVLSRMRNIGRDIRDLTISIGIKMR